MGYPSEYARTSSALWRGLLTLDMYGRMNSRQLHPYMPSRLVHARVRGRCIGPIYQLQGAAIIFSMIKHGRVEQGRTSTSWILHISNHASTLFPQSPSGTSTVPAVRHSNATLTPCLIEQGASWWVNQEDAHSRVSRLEATRHPSDSATSACS